MSHGINQELFFFLKSILTGVLAAFIYDIVRIIRRIIKHGQIMIAVEDGVYWVLCAIFMFVMIYTENDGSVRGFAVIGIILGMVVYHGTVSKWIIRYISLLIHEILKILFKLLYVLLTPIRFIMKRFFKVYKSASKKAGKTSNNFTKALKKKLKEVRMYLKSK